MTAPTSGTKPRYWDDAVRWKRRAEEAEADLKEARMLLRYLWQEAEVELRPIAGKRVKDAFADNDPLALDVERLIAAQPEVGE